MAPVKKGRAPRAGICTYGLLRHCREASCAARYNSHESRELQRAGSGAARAGSSSLAQSPRSSKTRFQLESVPEARSSLGKDRSKRIEGSQSRGGQWGCCPCCVALARCWCCTILWECISGSATLYLTSCLPILTPRAFLRKPSPCAVCGLSASADRLSRLNLTSSHLLGVAQQ